MTELERRALLGDRQAQVECTRAGIVLPCPMCSKKMREHRTTNWLAKRDEPIDRILVEHPPRTGCHWDNWCFVKEKDLGSWNTRPAPPVGCCSKCENWYKEHCAKGPCATEETDPDYYCKNFTPREVQNPWNEKN